MNLNTSIPLSNGWRTDVNDTHVQVAGTSTLVDAGAQSSSGCTSVDLNSTAPAGAGAWISYENNGASSSNTVTTYAVCGRTTS